MAQVLREVADLGFVIAWRFYGRYPETGRSFYHPPLSDTPAASTDDNVRSRRSPARLRPWASSLILPPFSAPTLSEFFAKGPFRNIDGVLPSPAALSVGAH